MCNQASIKPLALSDDLDWENLDNKSTDMDVTDTFQSAEDSIDEPTMITVTPQNGDKATTETVISLSEKDGVQAAANNTPKDIQSYAN
jgi:hypothetical protein